MKVLFQSGTFISSENLNLLSAASNDCGVIKGCELYEDIDTNSLYITNGFVQFKDGTLVYLKDEDKISLDKLPRNNYYVYIVRYGNTFVLETNVLLPSDYEYVVLAEVNIDDDVEIHNVKKVKNYEKIIEGYSIKDSMLCSSNIIGIANSKDYTNYSIYFSATLSGGQGFIAVPFTFPNFKIAKVKLKAHIDENVGLTLKINKGSTTKYESKEINFNKFKDDEYEFNIDKLDEIHNGDLCSIILSLSSTDNLTEHIIKIYSILMQT